MIWAVWKTLLKSVDLIYFAFLPKEPWIGNGIEGSPFPFSLSIDKYLSPTFPAQVEWDRTVIETKRGRFMGNGLLRILKTPLFWCTAHILPEIPKAGISYLFKIHPRLDSYVVLMSGYILSLPGCWFWCRIFLRSEIEYLDMQNPLKGAQIYTMSGPGLQFIMYVMVYKQWIYSFWYSQNLWFEQFRNEFRS